VPGCHGLVPWSFTLAATQPNPDLFGCHGLVPWSFTLAATNPKPNLFGCHGLVPWSFTLAAIQTLTPPSSDATGLSRGGSRSLLFSCEREPSTAQGRGIQFCWLDDWYSGQRDTPRGKPVASLIGGQRESQPVASLICGQRESQPVASLICGQRESPRGKPVASLSRGQREAPRGEPVALVIKNVSSASV